MKYKKKLVKFKKGDVVKVINNKDYYNSDLILNEIYIVEGFKDDQALIVLNKYFHTSKSNIRGGYHHWRFEKIDKQKLTKEDKFDYIKYKLGVRDECQKK